MAYTVNKLAKLSGVTVRTLHFYDEVGLLKPAYYGRNNYRYYEKEQLLLLQQILFFRELGLPLIEIKRILCSSEFDLIKTLQQHKKILAEKHQQTDQLLKTIEKTIQHLRGKHIMKEEEFYYGFDSQKQKQYEKYLLENGIINAETLIASKNRTDQWNDHEKDLFLREGTEINVALIVALKNGLAPASAEVQDLIRQHFNWVKRCWTPDKTSYIGLAELYHTPAFKRFYDNQHPQLLNFLTTAMEIFALTQL